MTLCNTFLLLLFPDIKLLKHLESLDSVFHVMSKWPKAGGPRWLQDRGWSAERPRRDESWNLEPHSPWAGEGAKQMLKIEVTANGGHCHQSILHNEGSVTFQKGSDETSRERLYRGSWPRLGRCIAAAHGGSTPFPLCISSIQLSRWSDYFYILYNKCLKLSLSTNLGSCSRNQTWRGIIETLTCSWQVRNTAHNWCWPMGLNLQCWNSTRIILKDKLVPTAITAEKLTIGGRNSYAILLKRDTLSVWEKERASFPYTLMFLPLHWTASPGTTIQQTMRKDLILFSKVLNTYTLTHTEGEGLGKKERKKAGEIKSKKGQA